MFSKPQLWILAGCAVIIVLGGIVLAIDRFIVRADEPPLPQQRAEVAAELGLEEVADAAELGRLAAMLEPFAPLFGRVSRIDAVLRQQQANATLWLVEFHSRQRDSLLDRGVSHTGVNAPRILLLVELASDPGWPAFLQDSATAAPAQLPAAWQPRLARLAEWRMGIDQGRVVFVSQLQGSALVQMVEARTSPEFHPGLLNSALRVEVQQALDIVAAMPGAPALERFYRIDVDVNLPEIDRSALDGMRTRQSEIQAKMEADRAALREKMDAERAAFRQRNEENLARFRERNAAANERLQSQTQALREGIDSRPPPRPPESTPLPAQATPAAPESEEQEEQARFQRDDSEEPGGSDGSR